MTTERGAYTLDGASSGAESVRNPGARYWLPTAYEWYKAAYHQPSDQGGPGDHYWAFPTASNSTPRNEAGPLPLTNQINGQVDNKYSVTQSETLDPNQNYLTDGGAYEASVSHYGTYDQGGNTMDWTGTPFGGGFFTLRGGNWSHPVLVSGEEFRFGMGSDDESRSGGIRIAGP